MQIAQKKRDTKSFFCFSELIKKMRYKTWKEDQTLRHPKPVPVPLPVPMPLKLPLSGSGRENSGPPTSVKHGPLTPPKTVTLFSFT